MALADLWPLLGLRITTPRLELRVPDDADLAELVEVARAGVHDPDTMPFAIAWTDLASPEFERSALQYHWRCRADFSPARWDLGFVVVLEGRVIGMQSLHAANFAVLRSIETGSWLGLAYQGCGIGKEMRGAVVDFAFEHLDARTVTSGAFEDNIASQRVSIATGYEPNGVDSLLRRGAPAPHLRFRLTRERWAAGRSSVSTEVAGFDQCRSMFGLDDPPSLADPTGIQ